jgi:hypothetical protein
MEIQQMNQQHKEETINKIIIALGDDIGSTFLNRLKPLLDLAYEASYNQAIKDAAERQSTMPWDQPVPQKWESYPHRGCQVCGIGADGKAYGYVCNRDDCPTRVTC